MYAVRDKNAPEMRALTDYFRTREEAEKSVAARTKSDADGKHAGHEFLEIVEVERESRPCRFCGSEVQADDPATDFCRGCHYTGRHQDDARSEQIEWFQEQLGCDVHSEHTGGGCFWMAFYFDQTAEFYVATDGEASLPTKDGEPIRDGWGYVGRHGDDEDSPEFNGVVVAEPVIAGKGIFESGGHRHDLYWDEYPQHCLADAQVVEAIKADRRSREGT